MPSASGPSKSQAPKNDQADRGRPLRFSSLMAVCFLVPAALALAYVAGVMSGRAYYRGPQPNVVSAPRDAAPGEQIPFETLFALGVELIQEGAGEGGRILTAEELHFAGALRNAPGDRVHAEKAQPAGATAATHSKDARGTVSVTPMQPAQAMHPAPPMQLAVAEGQAPAPPPKPVESSLFDYTFQVGVFKDEDTVDALRQRLEGRGLRTRMQREGKLYVVFVLMRGTESRVAELGHILEELRLGAPLLRGKKPVRQ